MWFIALSVSKSLIAGVGTMKIDCVLRSKWIYAFFEPCIPPPFHVVFSDYMIPSTLISELPNLPRWVLNLFLAEFGLIYTPAQRSRFDTAPARIISIRFVLRIVGKLMHY